MEKNKLKNRVALITGASGGIGRAISIAMAEEGINQLITGRSKDKLAVLKQKIEEAGARAYIHACDLLDKASPELLVKKAIEEFGQLDILINNAGVAMASPLEETTLEQWNLHMDLNARVPFLLCNAAVPYLRKSQSAAIINIASIVATKGYINQGAYTASKHALIGFTKVLAQEVFKDDIRVHVISPGGVETDLVTKTRPDLDTSSLMRPEEVAEIVMFLLKFRGRSAIDEINVRRFSKAPWQ